jgi:hypothetical protein
MAGLSIRAYARHRGVSHTAVRKALAGGRITLGSDGLIDAEAADRQWASATDITKPRNSVTGAPKRAAQPASPALAAPPDSVREPQAGGIIATDGNAARLAASYAPSRGLRESYMARMAKLEYEQMVGKLVDAHEVRAHLFSISRQIRESLLGIPDRLAAVLAGVSDRAEVHRLLQEEITSCLAELSNASAVLKATKQELAS